MKLITACALTVALAAAAGCRSTSPSASRSSAESLTGATLTFATLDNGKDDGSAVTAQLLRNGSELAAEVRSAGTAFDDNSLVSPLAMSVTGPLNLAETPTANLRLRLTPEGRDTWSFDTRLTLTYANGAQRNYAWSDLRLDETSPERTLTLAGAQIP